MTQVTIQNCSGQGQNSFGAYHLLTKLTFTLTTPPLKRVRYSTTNPARVGMHGWYGIIENAGNAQQYLQWWRWIQHEDETNLFATTGGTQHNVNGLIWYLYPGCVAQFDYFY